MSVTDCLSIQLYTLRSMEDLDRILDTVAQAGYRYVEMVGFISMMRKACIPGRMRGACGSLPAGALQARNSKGHAGYDGPCPPNGTHHYRFTIYALRSATTLDNGIDTARALDAIDGKAIGRGTLVGTVTAG